MTRQSSGSRIQAGLQLATLLERAGINVAGNAKVVDVSSGQAKEPGPLLIGQGKDRWVLIRSIVASIDLRHRR
ncbi:hypothetical protein [Burkholderia sp. PU8-34]